jgi:tRNA(fMet)-specific endonuclease VapC
MADYLLDSNHVSPLITLGHPLRRRVLDRHQAGDIFAIAVPALTEVLFGIHLLPRAKSALAEWNDLKTRFNYYGIDQVDAEQAAVLQVVLRRQGRQLATVDALIATVALRNNLSLLTTDQDFAAISGLNQQNWITS